MYLLEHDAKALAAAFGIPCPPGALWGEALPPGPWVVKGQVAAGGRGKAGAIRKAVDAAELEGHARAIAAMAVRGQPVRAVRIEQNVGPAQEAYVALLIDELRARGLKPYNFLDVRTGGMRGDPTRLIRVLEWIAEGPRVRVVLVNIFAGITHLGEFARLLLQARAAVPQLAVPFVVRLVGTAFEEAAAILGAAGIAVTTELEQAVAQL